MTDGPARTVLLRGGGDLATGVAVRLHRAGFRVVITELPAPLAVRRAVAFSEAVYNGECTVEGVHARRADSLPQALAAVRGGAIPVLVAPEVAGLLTDASGQFQALIDARLLKQPVAYVLSPALLIIGLGPGFTAGENCHVFIETRRGHTLGRACWQGAALADSGQPDGDGSRVLRAPAAGVIETRVEIGQHVEAGQELAVIRDQSGAENEHWIVTSPLAGVVRGLIHPGSWVGRGLKIGDIDPRDQHENCFMVSDKALAVGGGVLEAVLAWQAAGGSP